MSTIDYPESVSRICSELSTVATQMHDLQRQHLAWKNQVVQKSGGGGSNPEAGNENAMEVDGVEQEQGGNKLDVDPETAAKIAENEANVQKQLVEKGQAGNVCLSVLKTLNRQAYQQERSLRNDLTDQKLNVGKVDLGYQNIKYQRKYLMNEIARCHDMETFYQDVPLVPLDQFREQAPPELVQPLSLSSSSMEEQNDHQLMLNRLQFELAERKRLDAEKRQLLGVKAQLTKVNKIRKAHLNKIERQLEAYIHSSQALQDLFQEPVEPTQTLEQLLKNVAEGTATASTAPAPPVPAAAVAAPATGTTTAAAATTAGSETSPSSAPVERSSSAGSRA